MGVDEAALHLHHCVISLLCVLLVVEGEEANCLVGVDEVDVQDLDEEARRDVLLGENPSLAALNGEPQPGDEKGVIW